MPTRRKSLSQILWLTLSLLIVIFVLAYLLLPIPRFKLRTQHAVVHKIPPLHAAIEDNVSLSLIQKTIEENPEDINQDIPVTGTPLAYACATENYQLAELLLARGADPNQIVRSDSGYKDMGPLHIAAIAGLQDIAKLLVEYGADPLLKDAMGRSSIQIADSNGYVQLANWLNRAVQKH